MPGYRPDGLFPGGITEKGKMPFPGGAAGAAWEKDTGSYGFGIVCKAAWKLTGQDSWAGDWRKACILLQCTGIAGIFKGLRGKQQK